MITSPITKTLRMTRQATERRRQIFSLPFITEEGLVLIDRRAGIDRRFLMGDAWNHATSVLSINGQDQCQAF